MSLVTRLVDLMKDAVGSPGGPAQPDDVSDEHLAAAALLVHVARVDGRVGEEENRALLELLGKGFGLPPEAAERLLARADRFDFEVDDVAALVEMMGHADAGADHAKLLSMAYRVASADGVVGEFEDDLIWRMGRLLRLGTDTIEQLRAEALGRRDSGG